MKRTVAEEILDSGEATEQEVQDSLADLRRINRRYGGTEAMRALLERVASASGRSRLTVLDVAAGSGDALASAAESLANSGIEVVPTYLDRRPEHLLGVPSERRVGADALALPFRADTFDVVCCSLFLHHLEPPEIAKFFGEALRVSRLAFVANDLVRSRMHLLLNYLAWPTFRRVTRHDAPTSVRRSYTEAEISAILRGSDAPLLRLETSKHYLYRYGVIAWKARTATT